MGFRVFIAFVCLAVGMIIYVAIGVTSEPKTESDILFSCDDEGGYVRTNYFGTKLVIPAEFVSFCEAGDGPSVIAPSYSYISMNFKLPELIADKHANPDDVLYMKIYGFEPQYLESRPHIKAFEPELDLYDHLGEEVYKQSKSYLKGYDYYNAVDDAPPNFAKELFVLREINSSLILRCGEHGEDQCCADARPITQNLMYAYCVNKKHIGLLASKDEEIRDFIKDIQRGKSGRAD